MSGRLNKAREKLSEQILENFKGKITGNYSDVCIGENPENRYFVGKLLPLTENQTMSTGSDVFIESIGVDFYIDADEINNASLKIYPKGDFYYRAYPTLDQQRETYLNELNDSLEVPFESFEDFMVSYEEDSSKFDKAKCKLIPVYKKVNIHQTGFCLNFNLKEIIDRDTGYGFVGENHSENIALDTFIDQLQDDIKQDKDCYIFEVYEKTKIKNLISEEKYSDFINKNAKKEFPIRQNWNIYIDIQIKLITASFVIENHCYTHFFWYSNFLNYFLINYFFNFIILYWFCHTLT